LGDSVAIDGCCLTVVEIEPGHLSFEAASETLARTSLGVLAVGDAVHLERALCFGDRLGGHLVSGHIDAVGHVKHREMRGSALYLTIEAPNEVARLTASRGSITIAGVSLTVTDVVGNAVSVGLIPHTLTHTTLGALAVGDAVNLEADLIARYVERLLAHPSVGTQPGAELQKQAAHSSKRSDDGV
jgi:riboflavin synthase